MRVWRSERSARHRIGVLFAAVSMLHWPVAAFILLRPLRVAPFRFCWCSRRRGAELIDRRVALRAQPRVIAHARSQQRHRSRAHSQQQ